jgi:IclR family transcriptional regulator, acetate operon repressor
LREATGTGMSSVHTTLRVLEEVARRQPVGVSGLARAMELPKSTVQRCLITLREAGWLCVVDDRSRWGVTSKPFELGLRAVGTNQIREVGQPFIEELRRETDETIHLSVRSGDSLVIVSREDSLQPVRTYVELGTRAPIHATASGLAILAAMSDEEASTHIRQGLDACTDTTIVDTQDLTSEVSRTRERGYSVNVSSWWRTGVSAVGAAVTTSSGRPVAAIAISIPSSRFDIQRVPYLGSRAVDTAKKLGHALDTLGG